MIDEREVSRKGMTDTVDVDNDDGCAFGWGGGRRYWACWQLLMCERLWEGAGGSVVDDRVSSRCLVRLCTFLNVTSSGFSTLACCFSFIFTTTFDFSAPCE